MSYSGSYDNANNLLILRIPRRRCLLELVEIHKSTENKVENNLLYSQCLTKALYKNININNPNTNISLSGYI